MEYNINFEIEIKSKYEQLTLIYNSINSVFTFFIF